MMLLQELETLNHSKAKRNHFSQLLGQYPDRIKELFVYLAQVHTPISCKAAWGLEFACRQHLPLILPYIDDLLVLLPLLYQDAAIRPMAKICEQLCLAFYAKKEVLFRKRITLRQREQITTQCFDWLISHQKVAAQAYSMTALYHLGTEFKWIYPELQMILAKEYSMRSAAYQARARIILKKIA